MIKPCLNPGLPRVILVMAPDIRIDLGKSIPLGIGMEIAVQNNGSKFMAVVTDQSAELLEEELTILCKLQKTL